MTTTPDPTPAPGPTPDPTPAHLTRPVPRWAVVGSWIVLVWAVTVGVAGIGRIATEDYLRAATAPTAAVAGPQRHAAAPVALGGYDTPPCALTTPGSGQCPAGVPGGPVVIDGRWVCPDRAGTLLSGASGPVCDYRLVSTASDPSHPGWAPVPVLAPAADGGTGFVCPDGWELDGSVPTAPRCVPWGPLLDT